jgi:hypothetical protein
VAAVLDDSVTQELARAAAELLSIADGADVRSLHRLSELAVRQVAACSGATAVLWRDGEPIEMAATHPDLADLFALAQEAGPGPWQQALSTGQTAYCPDTLTEERWPGYASTALERGVRCSVTLTHAFGPMTVTLTMFGARPRALDPARVGVAELLIAFGGATLGNAAVYSDSQRTAYQLRESAESRMIVDQAKGVLMHALGCSAAEAFERMRQISQTKHVKVTDVATTIIKAHRSAPGSGKGLPGAAQPGASNGAAPDGAAPDGAAGSRRVGPGRRNPGGREPGPGSGPGQPDGRRARGSQAATRTSSSGSSSSSRPSDRPAGSDRS